MRRRGFTFKGGRAGVKRPSLLVGADVPASADLTDFHLASKIQFMAPARKSVKARRRRTWRAGNGRLRRPRPYYDVALQAAGEALHERLVHDFWEYFKKVREERPEIQEAEAVIGKAITAYFSPEQIKVRLARKRRRRSSGK